jgi:hypothetical protein
MGNQVSEPARRHNSDYAVYNPNGDPIDMPLETRVTLLETAFMAHQENQRNDLEPKVQSLLDSKIWTLGAAAAVGAMATLILAVLTLVSGWLKWN